MILLSDYHVSIFILSQDEFLYKYHGDSSRRVEEWDGQQDDSRFFVSAYQVKSLIRYHHDMEKYCTTSTAYFRLPLATSLLCNQRLKSIKSFYRDTIR